MLEGDGVAVADRSFGGESFVRDDMPISSGGQAVNKEVRKVERRHVAL